MLRAQPRRRRRGLERAHADPRLARHAQRRRGETACAAARRRGDSCAHRRLPPPLLLAGEARLARGDGARDLPAGGLVRLLRRLSAPRRSRDEPRDGIHERPARPHDPGLGRGAALHARTRPRAAAADHGRAALERRRVLQRGRRLHDARARRAHGRHLGRVPRPLRERAAAAEAGPLPLSRGRAPRRRGRRALRRRQPLRVARADARATRPARSRSAIRATTA